MRKNWLEFLRSVGSSCSRLQTDDHVRISMWMYRTQIVENERIRIRCWSSPVSLTLGITMHSHFVSLSLRGWDNMQILNEKFFFDVVHSSKCKESFNKWFKNEYAGKMPNHFRRAIRMKGWDYELTFCQMEKLFCQLQIWNNLHKFFNSCGFASNRGMYLLISLLQDKKRCEHATVKWEWRHKSHV